MYNGIGLQTARGSGTNGYVQRNLCFVKKSKDQVNYRTEEELKKIDAALNRKPNEEILEHQRKRKIEVKCFEMQELMEEQGYDKEEIDMKVALFRERLLEEERKALAETQETSKVNSNEMSKRDKLKEALGLGQNYKDGSSLAPLQTEKDALALIEQLVAKPDDSSSSKRKHHEEKSKKKKKRRS